MKAEEARCTAWLGAGHFAVDFVCASVVVTLPQLGVIDDRFCFLLVICYNFLAFCCQPLLGHLLDQLAIHRLGVTLGLVVCAVGAAIAATQPIVAVVAFGVGNALFHVGGGAMVYHAAPGRAAMPGVFIAPGGIGLATGMYLGRGGSLNPLWLATLLGLGALLLHLFPPYPDQPPPVLAHSSRPDAIPLPVIPFLLILLAVGLRSFLGFSLSLHWVSAPGGMVALALAAYAGKSAGGFLADHFRWRPFCGCMLAAAATLAFLDLASLAAACISLFCVQSTTGVTLAAIQASLPRRPAFAFGLPCVALFVGALPFLQIEPQHVLPLSSPLLCIAALLSLSYALPDCPIKEAPCPSRKPAAS